MDGVIILNKGEGITSQTAVNKIKRLFGVKKAGHTGTLDPMARGVLPILVGRAVKASEFMLTGDKHYIATLRLGITTDTEDTTGEILTKCDNLPSESEVLAACDSFVGKYLQTPPMYSALKVGGKKLCDLAREGVTVEREPREIEIYSIRAERISEREYSLDVQCSKGTYIRTLCADIGARLGVGGAMSALLRAEAAGFTLADSHTLEEIEALSEKDRQALIVPTEEIFSSLEKITLPPFFARLAHSGLEIYLKKIGRVASLGERFRLADGEGFFAVGEVRLFDGGLAIKPIRQLRD